MNGKWILFSCAKQHFAYFNELFDSSELVADFFFLRDSVITWVENTAAGRGEQLRNKLR